MNGRELIRKMGGYYPSYVAYFSGLMTGEEKEVFEQQVICSFLLRILRLEGRVDGPITCDHYDRTDQ